MLLRHEWTPPSRAEVLLMNPPLVLVLGWALADGGLAVLRAVFKGGAAVLLSPGLLSFRAAGRRHFERPYRHFVGILYQALVPAVLDPRHRGRADLTLTSYLPVRRSPYLCCCSVRVPYTLL